jgi:ferrochelatase
MSADGARFGLVVMAHGTPRTPDEVADYYTDIRRGRPPTAEQLDDLVRRYEAIGGISPLAERTEAQRVALERALAERMPDRWTVVLGQKHAPPFIEDAVAGLAEAGVRDAVGLVMAPHFSRFSVGEYQRRAAEAGSRCGVTVSGIDHWHLEPAYLDFLADATRAARVGLPPNHRILFTAHSLPERALVDDPYPAELGESATAVAARVGLPDDAWGLCWQSAGRTPEPWRGPDVLEVIRGLGASRSCDAVLVCAQGFTADHLEILYDLDVEARGVARDAGLGFARTRSLNDAPPVMSALAERVIARVVGSDGLGPGT